MPIRNSGGVRAIALVGPNGAGKTALMEALLSAAGSTERQVGDASPEAKARGQSVELNLAHFDFMGDRYAIVDCPGSVEFACDGDGALAGVDLALVVCDPDPARAGLVQPAICQIEALGVPHAIFVNKIDQARGNIHDLITALQPMSRAPLVARQLPIREGDHTTGFVDLALERAFVYRPGAPSERIEISADLMLKATKVDGVYTADPKKDPTATRYEELTYDEALDRRLGVMDQTALVLCRDHKIRLKVYDMDRPKALLRIVTGDNTLGTLVRV